MDGRAAGYKWGQTAGISFARIYRSGALTEHCLLVTCIVPGPQKPASHVMYSPCTLSATHKCFQLFTYFLNIFFKSSLYPTWSSNSQVQNQQSHVLLAEPDRHPRCFQHLNPLWHWHFQQPTSTVMTASYQTSSQNQRNVLHLNI